MEQLHAGKYKNDSVYHSDDGGKTWWSGFMFDGITKKQLLKLAISLIQDLKEQPDE